MIQVNVIPVSATGVITVTNNNSFIIYPNPASDNITISNKSIVPESYVVSIKSIQGQEVLSEKINMLTTPTMNLSGLSNGVYILTLRNERENYVRKIVISH